MKSLKTSKNLAKGNRALRCGQYTESIRHYVKAFLETPELGNHIINNLNLARKRYRSTRETVLKLDVAVSCWELAHNPAGRAYTLAMLYQSFANVEIIGTLFPGFGREIWEPIRDTPITKHSFIVENEEQFIEQAVELVLAHPYDIVHLSKPRAPNLFIGVLYKVIWGAKVLMDIDDEELAFVNAELPISLDEYLESENGEWPSIYDLAGKTWTRIAVGMAKEFDGVTVSNIALQQRYGGEIIHHARDGSAYNFTLEQKRLSRNKFGIGREKKVILFFGTPRKHKGLIETAHAIAALNRKDIVFAIVGEFPNGRLKSQLQSIRGVDYCFIGNQSFSSIPEVVAIGDICVLLQDPTSQVSQYQVPAKLSDAMAMGIPVLVSDTSSLADVFQARAAIPITECKLANQIACVLDDSVIYAQISKNSSTYFLNELCSSKNIDRLKRFVFCRGCQSASDLADKFFYHRIFRLSQKKRCPNSTDGRISPKKNLFINHITQRSENDSVEPSRYFFKSEAAQYVKRLPVDCSPVEMVVKAIAFYLPQFHSIPENDHWWGEGFTEWTNVKPATPQFFGQYQPHVPDDFLGYYDLLNIDVQHKQIELAKQYGVYGFCFYLYWFAGHRLLERPVDNYLADKSLDLPFCVCWANENWSRRWDGLDQEILIEQKHSPEDDIDFISNTARYMRDPRYICINKKPMLLVYRPNIFPDIKSTAARWRTWCRENGIGEIYLVYPQSFECVDPVQYGFDAACEFPPNNSAPPNITNQTISRVYDFQTTVYDWRVFLERSENYIDPGYTLFRGLCPSWDNTARNKNKGTVFHNTNPRLFESWAVNAFKDTVSRFSAKDQQIVFINAWNEWAEGAHLEPDRTYGYAWLNSIRAAHSKARNNG